jgi:hypothetical protein
VTKKEFVLFYNNLVSRLLSVQVSPSAAADITSRTAVYLIAFVGMLGFSSVRRFYAIGAACTDETLRSPVTQVVPPAVTDWGEDANASYPGTVISKEKFRKGAQFQE